MILVLGESGLGKSTLINSLFLTDVLASGGICYRPEKTREIREHKVCGTWGLGYLYSALSPESMNAPSSSSLFE